MSAELSFNTCCQNLFQIINAAICSLFSLVNSLLTFLGIRVRSIFKASFLASYYTSVTLPRYIWHLSDEYYRDSRYRLRLLSEQICSICMRKLSTAISVITSFAVVTPSLSNRCNANVTRIRKWKMLSS